MRTVSISYGIRYEECKLAAKFAERLPVVKVFYDANFERSERNGGIVDIVLDENNLDKVYEGTLIAGVHRRDGDIPATACIGFASFAMRRNAFGVYCFIDAGTAHVQIGDILEATKRGRAFERRLPLVLHTAKQIGTADPGVEKGTLVFTVSRVDMGGVGLRQGPAPLEASIKTLDTTLVEYIQRTMRQSAGLQDTIPGTERIRAPMDISESGVEFTNAVPLPVAAYSMFEVPRSNLEYWRNALALVMRRMGQRPTDYAVHTDVEDRAHLLGLMVTLEAQSFDYISDEVDRNTRHARYQQRLRQGYENFGDALTTTSGDCEDTACAIQQVFRSFMAFEFPSDETALRELQELGKQYVPLLSLAVVHGAEATDGEEAPKGAHMYDTFLTRYQFERMLKRTREGRAALGYLHWDTGVVADPAVPTLFGEGTGIIDPLGRHDPLIDARRYLASAQSLAGFKKEIPHERGAASPFYLGNLLGITSEFFRNGGNVGGFLFGTLTATGDAAKSANAPEMTRGALFTHIINQSDRIALMPQPPIPRHVMEIMRAATRLRVPPKPLELDPENKRGGPKDPLLDELVSAVASYRRAPSSERGAGPVHVYMRPHQYDRQVIEAIIADMSRLSRVWKVDYEIEHITTTIYQYRLMIHVNMDHDNGDDVA